MLRRLRAVPSIRWGFSFLVALTLMAGTLEAGLPDVHDRQGDVQRTVSALGALGSETVAEIAVVDDGLDVGACVQSPDAHEATCDAGSSASPSSSGGARGDERGQSRAPAHDFHVEHCGHAHYATRASTPQAAEPHTERAPRPIAHIAVLRSVASAPSLRPPIV